MRNLNLFKLKNQENQRGAALVEFAIILPLLTLLLAGIIEFSLLLYNQQVITNASREGARAAVIPVPKLNNGQIKKIVVDYCEDKMISFADQSNALTVYINNKTNPITESNATDIDNNSSEATIITEFEYSFLLPGILKINPPYTFPLTSTAIMKNL